jgi:hypothetical protein
MSILTFSGWHLSILLLTDHLNAHFFTYVFISIIYVFRANLCSSSWESIVSIQHLVYLTLCRWPSRVWAENELLSPHTRRSPTWSEIYQMLYWFNWFSWWWARDCSKHVENWNKYIEKNCASSWSFTKNHNKMHGQQNIRNSAVCSGGVRICSLCSVQCMHIHTAVMVPENRKVERDIPSP